MIGFLIGIAASLVFIYPVFQGLVLLPLDLLVSNSAPWFLANQILIKNSYMLDSITQLFPWRHLTFTSLTNGIVPLWNPYQFSGLPFMAGFKPMVFYPLNVLFFLGEVRAWNILLFFQLFLAFVFMYMLMRKLRISVWGSLLSSIAFAYSSFMVGFLEFGSDGHALVWLPFLFYCVYSYLKEKKGRFLFGLSIGLAFGITAGHLQMTTYQCLFIAFFTVYFILSRQSSWKDGVFVFSAMAVGCGLAAIQLVPGVELFAYSYRGLGGISPLFEQGLIRAHELLRIFSPDMFGHPSTKDLHIGYIETSGYIGIIPLFFAFVACRFFRKEMLIRFFMLTALGAVVFSLWPLGLVIAYLRIPIISSGSGGRLFFLALFSLAILSGYGLDTILRMNDWKKFFRWAAVYTGGIVLLFITAFIINKKITYFGATVTNLKFCTGMVIGFFFLSLLQMLCNKKGKIVTWLFLILLLSASYFDLFRMGYRFLTFSNTKFMYPDIPVVQFVRNASLPSLSRVYGLAGSEVPTYLGVYSLETYNPLYPMRTGVLLKTLEGKDAKDLPTNVFQFSYSERLKYVLDVLGTSYIVTQNDQDPSISYFRTPLYQKDLTKIYSDDRHDVYENKAAYPRFGLFYRVKDALPESAILEDMKTGATDLKTTILLEESLPQELTFGTGSARLVRTDVNNQEFIVETTAPALFYVSDAYFPGWNALVNGKEMHIYRANYNFRGVLVPQGESRVVFRYEPVSYEAGKIISILSFLLLGVLTWINGRMHKVPHNEENKKPRSGKSKPRSPKK